MRYLVAPQAPGQNASAFYHSLPRLRKTSQTWKVSQTREWNQDAVFIVDSSLLNTNDRLIPAAITPKQTKTQILTKHKCL